MTKLLPLTAADLTEVLPLFNKVFYGASARKCTYEQLWVKLKQNGFSSALSFGVYAQKQLRGFCLAGEVHYKQTAAATIIALGTEVTQRRKGNGQLMLHKLAGVANAKNLRTIYVEVARTNTSALAFYQALGYSFTQTVHSYSFTTGKIFTLTPTETFTPAIDYEAFLLKYPQLQYKLTANEWGFSNRHGLLQATDTVVAIGAIQNEVLVGTLLIDKIALRVLFCWREGSTDITNILNYATHVLQAKQLYLLHIPEEIISPYKLTETPYKYLNTHLLLNKIL